MFQKMLFTILITISVLLTVTVVFPHEKGFSVTIPQATMPPEIDGIGKDVIWQFAPEVTIDNINTGGKVKKGEVSTAKAVYDKDNIYVLFINNSLDTRKMQMVAQKHDQDIWKDEENELFIDTEHDAAKPYYHIMINAKNVTQDAHNGGAENGWEAKLESATKINQADKNWVLEIKIPFKDLEVKKMPVGKTWGWNFNRHIVPKGGKDTWTGWATTGASFHTPNRFGDLNFGTDMFVVNARDKISTTWGALKALKLQ